MKSFTIYREYYDLITLLSEKEQANILLAITKYMFEDKEINLNDKEKKIFINLKRPLDKSKKQSSNVSQRWNNNTNQDTKNNTKQKTNYDTKQNTKNNTKKDTHQDVNVSNYDNNYVVNVNGNVNVNNIFNFIEENFGRTLSPIEYEEINTWEDNELTRYAIRKAILKGKYNIQYISTILFNYKKNGIKTVQQARADEEAYNSKSKKEPKWLNEKIEVEESTKEDRKEMEDLLKSFK